MVRTVLTWDGREQDRPDVDRLVARVLRGPIELDPVDIPGQVLDMASEVVGEVLADSATYDEGRELLGLLVRVLCLGLDDLADDPVFREATWDGEVSLTSLSLGLARQRSTSRCADLLDETIASGVLDGVDNPVGLDLQGPRTLWPPGRTVVALPIRAQAPPAPAGGVAA